MTRRAVISLAACLLLTAGCSGRQGRSTTATPSAGNAARPSAAAPGPSVLPQLVLVADLGDQPVRWRRVAFIPFGGQPGQLGFKRFRESINSQPSSFAVAGDGSFWIDDRWKSRIAHFSSTGRYLEAIGAIRERGVDIVIVHGRVVVLTTQGGLHGGAVVAVPNPDGTLARTVINDGGRPLLVADLLPSDGVLGEIAGWAASRNAIGVGPIGIARLDIPGSGQAHLLPGLPVGGNASFSLRLVEGPGGDQNFRLTFSLDGHTDIQPLRVTLVVGRGSRSHEVPAEVGPGEYSAVGDDVLMYVKITPSIAADGKRYGGGRWLLRVGKSPVLWERLPGPQIPDEPQHRHLSVGPNGAIYLLVATPGGMEILRRP